MHARATNDPITLGSFLRQNNNGIDTAITVNAGQMALDGTISAGSNHGLKVGDTLILTSLNVAETTEDSVRLPYQIQTRNNKWNNILCKIN